MEELFFYNKNRITTLKKGDGRWKERKIKSSIMEIILRSVKIIDSPIKYLESMRNVVVKCDAK